MTSRTAVTFLPLVLACCGQPNVSPSAVPFALKYATDRCGTDGLRGTDLLNTFFQDYTGTLKAWSGPVHEVPLALSTSYDGGVIICQPETICSPEECSREPASVRTVFTIRFRLGDGTLDETFPTELTLRSRTAEAHWSTGDAGVMLPGTLAAETDGGRAVVSFSGSFSGLDTMGAISVSAGSGWSPIFDWTGHAGTPDAGPGDAGP